MYKVGELAIWFNFLLIVFSRSWLFKLILTRICWLGFKEKYKSHSDVICLKKKEGILIKVVTECLCNSTNNVPFDYSCLLVMFIVAGHDGFIGPARTSNDKTQHSFLAQLWVSFYCLFSWCSGKLGLKLVILQQFWCLKISSK